MSSETHYDVAIVGGGVAGTSASIFTARHGLDTVVLSAGGSLLRRNAHLENYPGFPAGVNSRLLLEMMVDQAERSGAERRDAEVTAIESTDEGFAIETASGERLTADAVIAATKNRTDYLADLDGVTIIQRGKEYVETDERGRTGVEGLYAAGRLAGKAHQTVIAAGHGAEVAVTVLEDHERGFYHDWVAPERYFSGRGINVPPGIEEIDEDERRRREAESIEVMREYFDEPHPDEPEQHPDVQ
ncbi:NAD(P)/FAD-dependent oxidoreductase [Halosolutus gelatinilyticus]|uniref:NAD(P)/FAD-dependent oxidoreductase n=1 Tax=Halosolutus gelatinilyticus TaxID=2931975 RepID=UPI001FF6B516|nr:FAD-dependent oxidoreductase [Halosolutus gelatinilyticus]